jgi:hypothetical protein
MWAHLLLSTILLADATAAPQATTAPTAPLRVIVTVKSSTLCSAVRKMAIPIGYVNRRNDDAFSSINRTMYAFLKQNVGAKPISVSEQILQNAGGDTGPEVAPINTYSILSMNKTAWQIAQNVTLESSVMQRSWKEFPKGKDANVDALRQRLQNLMDLQNALENKIMSFTQGVLDNAGNVSTPQLTALLGESLAGQAAALQASQQQSDPEMTPVESAADLAKSGTEAQVVRELRLQEIAFSTEIVKAGTVCGI